MYYYIILSTFKGNLSFPLEPILKGRGCRGNLGFPTRRGQRGTLVPLTVGSEPV